MQFLHFGDYIHGDLVYLDQNSCVRRHPSWCNRIPCVSIPSHWTWCKDEICGAASGGDAVVQAGEGGRLQRPSCRQRPWPGLAPRPPKRGRGHGLSLRHRPASSAVAQHTTCISPDLPRNCMGQGKIFLQLFWIFPFFSQENSELLINRFLINLCKTKGGQNSSNKRLK